MLHLITLNALSRPGGIFYRYVRPLRMGSAACQSTIGIC